MPCTGHDILCDYTPLDPHSETRMATIFLYILQARPRRVLLARPFAAGGGRGYGRAERLEDTPMRLAVTTAQAEWGKGYR